MGSTPTSGTKRKTALLFLNLAHARFLKHFRLFFAFSDKTQLALCWRVGRDLIRCFCSRIIFVCTFISSFFVLLFSSHRIIFEIKNKKEERKVAVEFFKAPNENAEAFCAYSRAKKKVPRKALSCFRRLSRPNATRNLWPPKMLAFLEKRSKQVIVSQCLCQQTKGKSAVCDAVAP